MKQMLLTSEVGRFELLMQGDEVVVRNYKKIAALFTVHFSNHPKGVRELLSQPEFSGTKADEKIQWTTDLFDSVPSKLSSLEGDEKARYKEILAQTLDDVRDVLALLPIGVANLLLKAVTYHSDDSVFCADDKVVLTEWGMRPKEKREVHFIALEGAKPPRFGFGKNEGPVGDQLKQEAEETPEETPETDPSETSPFVTLSDDGPEALSRFPEEEGGEGEEGEEEQVAKDETQPDEEKEPEKEKKKKKRWWLWLLLLIPLILLLLLLRKCGGENLTTPPQPINNEDIGWSGDSLTKIVNNRLILLFTEDKPVKEFVKDFRKLYPDKDKYQLYAPDMSNDLPRLILTLPMEKLDSVAECLPDDFAEYDLMVLPEAVFESGRSFSDPAFSDRKKSWYFDMISAQVAWDYTIGSPDIIVAVIDDGFDLNHPELKENIVKPYNAVAHNSNVYPAPDGIGHGTHVASTAVGTANNGKGSSGIAPGCKLMPIQVTDENGVMTTSALVDAVLYAIKNKADVVNMSLGHVLNPLIALLPDEMQEEIIKTQFKTEEKMWRKIFGMGMKNGKDIAFVLAGGNDNVLIGIDPVDRVEGTIRVSAVQPDKRKADFSNYGTYSVLSAPGVEIYNAVPDNKYESYDGTSMASPIVAGAYALMKSAYPNMSVKEITELLQRTGIPSPSKVGNIINFAYAFAYANGGGQPVQTDPATGNPVQTDPKTGDPIYIDPVTGNPAPTDPTTGDPVYIDPVTGNPAPTDPTTGEPIYKDPVTGQPAPKDPKTGEPIYKDPVSGNPAEKDPTSGKPIYSDPYTGQPVQTDPVTHKPIYKDPHTGNPVPTDPITKRPIYKDPKTGKVLPVDPITGTPAPINPTTGDPIYIDPVTGNPAPTDPKTGDPVYTDPVTRQPAPTDPITKRPIYKDPITNNPVKTDPITHKPIYKDPATQLPVPTDQNGSPIYKDPYTGQPAKIDPTTGKPIYGNLPGVGMPIPNDPKTGSPNAGNPNQKNPTIGQPGYTDPCPDCTEAQRRYDELMRQLEELKRNNPGCY